MSSRILIVRLSAHGDVVQALPLLSALKQPDANLPETTMKVGWLVDRSAAPLLENHPLLDHLHVCSLKQWGRMLWRPFQWKDLYQELRSFLVELREEKYTISLDVQGLLKSAVWPWLIGIPNRYGFKATREGASVFYNNSIPPMGLKDPNTFAVERYLDFARILGYPGHKNGEPHFVTPPITTVARDKVAQWLSLTELPSSIQKRPVIALAPFTRWPSKHWNHEYWIRLLKGLRQMNVQVVILGSPEDRPMSEQMLETDISSMQSANSQGEIINLVGLTTWQDLYAIFHQSDLMIGLDSAPLHIANAVGTPRIIGLYGPTPPGRTGPVGIRHTTLTTVLSCQPCFKRVCPLKTHACMLQLTPEIVLGMINQQLSILYGPGHTVHLPSFQS